MIEENEMDGGITSVDGKPMRIVLDDKGVYLRTEETKAPARPKPSALDAASEKARKTQPAAPHMPAATTAPAGGATPEGAPGTGFKHGT